MLGLRLLWRDWRGGELGILVASLIIAVSIVTGISLFAERLQQGIVAQSSHFLAADRVLQSLREVDSQWLDYARDKGLRQAQILSFQSMVFAGDAMQLASVKVVSDSYPLLGQLEVSDKAFIDTYKTKDSPASGEVWLDSRLLPLLNITVGEKITVGEAQLRVTRVVINEPDRGGSFYSFGPRVLMNIKDIQATQVVQPGSRVKYRYLFAGDANAVSDFGDWIKDKMLPSHKWLGLDETQPRISLALERARSFLLLAGALGVGLAGIAIALAARRYSERHYDYVAVMKSLGASSKKILMMYCTNLFTLALIATALGCALGWLIQEVFIALLQDYFSVASVPSITLRPFMVGAITALVCLSAFALPSFVSLGNVSPLRVLRRDFEGTGFSSLFNYAIGVAGIAVLMWWYSGDITLTLAVLSGVGLTFIIVGSVAWYLLRGGSLLGMQAGSAFRLALASMRRRGFQNAVQVVIFSLAIMLLLVLGLVRTSLIEEWQVQLPEGTPNHFLVNITEQEVQAVAKLLADNQLKNEALYPMVRGRLTQINGVAVNQRVSKDDNKNMDIDRELSLTWTDQLPTENMIEEGQWWSEKSAHAQVSIESQLAKRLDVVLGDQLVFQIGSESLSVEVTSIRTLDWDTMRPNFYMIFPPNVLNTFPATYMTSFYLSAQKKTFLNQFLRQFPTVTVLEMDSVIQQIRQIINQVSSAIELVLALIIVSGLLVLIASVQASLDMRFQESAILRTLGARRSLVLGSLVLEFSALGLLAGFLA
ncbi:MAG: FtsX-like permease family protein, partial [Spongiibacteraceae bacterium]|nr:FtsX-like permease family protein [Spongiibacteraceae bacterium]